MANLPVVVLPHPIGGAPLETVLAKVDAAVDEILQKLTSTLAPLPTTASTHDAANHVQRIELRAIDEWSDLQATFAELGWSDGLPLVPPTNERVAAMLRFADRPRTQVIGGVPPRMGAVTPEHVAVNAVMAGCRPHHLPLLITALEAMLDPSFNLYGIQCTTHCVAPLVVVNGPLAAKCGVHAANNLFGPGPWANGVLGRAIRLILLNIGGATPGEIDKATMGHPGKYTFCIGENEAANPWSSLRAERGFDADASTVTVVGAEAPHNINDHESTTAKGLLTMIAGTMAETGQNNVYYAGEPLLILGPEHAATIAADGLSKDDVRRILFAASHIPLGKFSAENIERRFRRKFAARYAEAPLDQTLPIAQSAADIMVIVAGGPGKHSMYVPTFGGTRSVTRAMVRSGGRPWMPADFD